MRRRAHRETASRRRRLVGKLWTSRIRRRMIDGRTRTGSISYRRKGRQKGATNLNARIT